MSVPSFFLLFPTLKISGLPPMLDFYSSPINSKRDSPSNNDHIDKKFKKDENNIWKDITLHSLDIKSLYRLIKAREGNINITNKDGYGLLYLAAHNKSMEALRILLLQPDINVNLLNGPHHELALHAACSKGMDDAVELLIENKSDLNITDSLGHTPIANTIFARSLPCLQLLIRTSKVDIHMIDSQHNTLLHLAAANNFPEAIEILIESGLQVNVPNQRGSSALALAITFGYSSVMNILIDKGKSNVNDKVRSMTVLHLAVTWNRLDAVKKLVEHQCTVNVMNELEETPLYLAVQQCKIDIVRYLVEEGKANPCFSLQPTLSPTNTPLLYAANHGYTDMCAYLLTPDTPNFFVEHAASTSKRAGHLLTEKYLMDRLNERISPAKKIDEEVVFDSLFNTFSDDEEEEEPNKIN
ncbi:ankyrin repeat-containing domain protein [Pilobolus umbonatus]|nr:ankyrin repeat-containing domain protein [Pilobolus umbonatus]